MQFAVYISDTPVPLKQSQGKKKNHNDNVDPKDDYKHAEFERTCFNGVEEKANVKVFFNEELRQLYPLNMCKIENSGIFLIYLT